MARELRWAAAPIDESALRRLIGRACQPLRTYDYKLWGFGEGPGIEALVACGHALAEPSWIDAAATLARRSVDRPPESPLADHVLPVPALAELRTHREIPGLESRLERWVELVNLQGRSFVRQPRRHRPDRADVGHWVWVDCMHTDGPGLAALGFAHEAVDVLLASCTALQHENGLFSHGYDGMIDRANAVHWGRGCGWALWGLADTLRRTNHPGLVQPLERLVAGLATYEVQGQWRTIVDDPDAPIERSVAALVAAALIPAISEKVLDESWLPLALRALETTVEHCLHDGLLPVSEATPVGAPDVYLSRSDGIYPWGQGPAALAFVRAHTQLTISPRSS